MKKDMGYTDILFIRIYISVTVQKVLALVFLCRTYYIHRGFVMFIIINFPNGYKCFIVLKISGKIKTSSVTLSESNPWCVNFSVKLKTAFSILIIAFQHLFP